MIRHHQTTEDSGVLNRVEAQTTLFLFGAITFNGFRPAGIPIADALLLVAIASLLTLNILGRGFDATAERPFLFFAGAVLSSTLVSEWFFASGGASIVEAVQLMTATVGLGALAYRHAQHNQSLDKLILWFVVGASISATIAVLEQVGFAGILLPLTGNTGFPFSGRSRGLTAHPNQLGLASAIALPLAYYCRNLRTGTYRVAMTACLTVLLGGIAASGSRAAVLAVLASGGFWLFHTVFARDVKIDPSWVGVRVLAASVAGGLMYVISPQFRRLLSTSLVRATGDSSTTIANTDRAERLDGAIDAIAASPLVGTGFSDSAAHSFPIQVLQTGGVLGLIGFFVLFYVAAMRIRQSHRAKVEASYWIGVTILGWAVAGLFHNGFTQRYFYLPIVLALSTGAFISTPTREPLFEPTESNHQTKVSP